MKRGSNVASIAKRTELYCEPTKAFTVVMLKRAVSVPKFMSLIFFAFCLIKVGPKKRGRSTEFDELQLMPPNWYEFGFFGFMY
jgi:hypothetical protein